MFRSQQPGLVCKSCCIVITNSRICRIENFTTAVLSTPHAWTLHTSPPFAAATENAVHGMQVKELNLEEGGAFTVSSADEILSAL